MGRFELPELITIKKLVSTPIYARIRIEGNDITRELIDKIIKRLS